MIKNLQTAHLKGVWQIVCSGNPELSTQKELVIDIEQLPTRTARELEKYVKTKVHGGSKKKQKNKNQLGFNETANENANQEVGGQMINELLQQSVGSEQRAPAGQVTAKVYNDQNEELNKAGIMGGGQQIQGGMEPERPADQNEEASSDSSFFTDLDSDDDK